VLRLGGGGVWTLDPTSSIPDAFAPYILVIMIVAVRWHVFQAFWNPVKFKLWESCNVVVCCTIKICHLLFAWNKNHATKYVPSASQPLSLLMPVGCRPIWKSQILPASRVTVILCINDIVLWASCYCSGFKRLVIGSVFSWLCKCCSETRAVVLFISQSGAYFSQSSV
jgi:hypothetical protein